MNILIGEPPMAEAHGSCGLLAEVDSDGQVIGRAGRFATLTPNSALCPRRDSHSTGSVRHAASHLQDIGRSCSHTLSSPDVDIHGVDKLKLTANHATWRVHGGVGLAPRIMSLSVAELQRKTSELISKSRCHEQPAR